MPSSVITSACPWDSPAVKNLNICAQFYMVLQPRSPSLADLRVGAATGTRSQRVGEKRNIPDRRALKHLRTSEMTLRVL
jgi:hypothetical protein